MQKTIFEISKMDFHSEEYLIRMKLNEFESVKTLDFDLENQNWQFFTKENLN